MAALKQYLPEKGEELIKSLKEFRQETPICNYTRRTLARAFAHDLKDEQE